MGWSIVVRGAVLLAGCCCLPAFADIYSYTAPDGSVSLTNVPTDRNYALLLAERGADAAPEAPAQDTAKLSGHAARYEALVAQTAQKFGLESALLHAVISVESRYDAKAVSKKGALGLMQLMPETAKRYKVTDALDPEQNLHGGASYLRDLLRLFDDDLSLALAAYNAGENKVIRSGYRIPPLKETLNYVPRVLGFYRAYHGGQAGAARTGAAPAAAVVSVAAAGPLRLLR